MDSKRLISLPTPDIPGRAVAALASAAAPGTSHEVDSAILGRADFAAVYETRFGPASVSIGHCESRAHVVLLMDGAAQMRFADGRREPFARLSLMGPTSGLARFESTGMLQMFGIVLQPAFWAAMRPSGVATLLDRVVPIGSVLGSGVAGLADRLAGAGSFAARATAAIAFADLVAGRTARDPRTAEFVALVDHWLDAGPRPRISTLVPLTGLSRRQVESRCKRLYGVSPRLLARRHRALKSADRLAAGDSVAEVIEDGYYDQSHLIREIRHFTGMTPRRLRLEPPLPTLREPFR